MKTTKNTHNIYYFVISLCLIFFNSTKATYANADLSDKMHESNDTFQSLNCLYIDQHKPIKFSVKLPNPCANGDVYDAIKTILIDNKFITNETNFIILHHPTNICFFDDKTPFEPYSKYLIVVKASNDNIPLESLAKTELLDRQVIHLQQELQTSKEHRIAEHQKIHDQIITMLD